MSNIIKTTYRNTVYLLGRLPWRRRDVRDDGIADRLGMYDLNVVSLNCQLDNKFPPDVGRFPQMLSCYSKIHDVIISAFDAFHRDQSRNQGDFQNTRQELRDSVSLAVANYLNSEIEAERRIFREHGFWSE